MNADFERRHIIGNAGQIADAFFCRSFSPAQQDGSERSGFTHQEYDIKDHDRLYYGRFALYRWHLCDPIPFRCSLRGAIGAGHTNDFAQHYESVACWYGRQL